VIDADLTTQWDVVDAFLAAARDGDFDALVAVLDPDVVLRADGGAVRAGASHEVRGARAVAGQALLWSRVDLTVRRALVNGAAGLAATRAGKPFSVGAVMVRGGKIVELDTLADSALADRLPLLPPLAPSGIVGMGTGACRPPRPGAAPPRPSAHDRRGHPGQLERQDHRAEGRTATTAPRSSTAASATCWSTPSA
jgi:ketosteroid isomerase-like protein